MAGLFVATSGERPPALCKFRPILHTLIDHAGLYIGGSWIRQPKGQHMKRLLAGLLLIAGVGCGPPYDLDTADTPANRKGFENHFGFAPDDKLTNVYYPG